MHYVVIVISEVSVFWCRFLRVGVGRELPQKHAQTAIYKSPLY